MNYQQFNSPYNKNKPENNYLNRLAKQLGGVLIFLLIMLLLKFGNTSITNSLNTKFKQTLSMDYTNTTKTFIGTNLPDLGKLLNNYKTKISTIGEFKLDYLPVEGTVTSSFGNRTNPITKKAETHNGIDINCKTGTAVKAIYDGTVEISGNSKTYGLRVVIDHLGGFKSTYAHLSLLKVKVGERVAKGSIIGLSGNTGESTGPHLHFELNKNNSPVNPIAYLDNR